MTCAISVRDGNAFPITHAPSKWGFLEVGHGKSSSSRSNTARATSLPLTASSSTTGHQPYQ
jgi:hypothetical protein